MTEIWQGIQTGADRGIPLLSAHPILAQTSEAASETASMPGSNLLSGGWMDMLVNLGLAIVTLIVGWIIAIIAAWIVKGILGSTDIDNKIAAWITGRSDGGEVVPIEKWAAKAVFWIVMLFVLVAFLNVLDLSMVSEPLNNFLDQIFAFLPRLGGALLLFGVGWLIATIAKMILSRGLQAFRLDDRLAQQMGTTPEESPLMLNETLGNVIYWLILLLFLPLVLEALGLQDQLQPIQNLVDQFLQALPKIVLAVAIGTLGWLIARVVRGIVTNLLAAAGTDSIGARVGLNPEEGGQSLSWILGTLVYALILILTAISALEELQIEAISGPAISMLEQILDALPKIFTAAVILIIAYVIGQFVSDLVTNILTGLGFNNVFSWLGLPSQPTGEPESEATEIQDTSRQRTPSEIIGVVVLVGIMLFAAVAAVNVLNFEGLNQIVTGLLYVFGRIIAGVIVFGVGLYLANLAFNLITSSGSYQARVLGQTARIAIIALISAMALQQMGIAPNIVNLAFGLLLGAIAVAIALAFGLGGRDVAAEQLREWLSTFKQSK